MFLKHCKIAIVVSEEAEDGRNVMFKLDSPLMNFLGKMCDLLILNLLALVCSIPVITAGASITAVYYICYKMVKNEEGYIVRGFFKAFKENFLQSTAIWIIQLLLMFILVMDFRIIVASGMSFPKPLIIAVIAGSMIFYLGMVFALPLQARFENKVKNTIKNSFLMFFSHLPITILLVVISIMPFVLVYFVDRITPVVLLMGFSVVAYCQSFFILKVFKPYEESYLASQENVSETVEESSDNNNN